MNTLIIIIFLLLLIFFSLLTLLILLISKSKKRNKRSSKRIVYQGNGLKLIFDRDSTVNGRYTFDHDKGSFTSIVNDSNGLTNMIVQLHPDDDYDSIAELQLIPVSFDHDDQFNAKVLFSSCCFPKLKESQSFRMTKSIEVLR